ncbi:uncharacterized protein PWA37_000775 [Arxiozyma heterogenica]|uniref:WD repeat-containing protein n=1 Tax=Arxiozyma heterogenica TaxID=278026 RepID=A0AAN7WHE5_9SACH|nr:hypothetical protein RI543_002301 [Kazachstania heterogenica]
MSAYTLLDTNNFGSDNWCFQLQPMLKHGLLISLSNGDVHLLDWNTNKSKQSFKIGNTSVNSLKTINSDTHNSDLFVGCSLDTVKLFDVRNSPEKPVASIKSLNSSPFLSVDSQHGKFACGTELKGVDAQLHIYDIRKLNSTWKSFIDSHHDDITCIKFHPSDPNVLLSGSTDGYTNIYDLTEEDEDDSLHQVINYNSIHSCGWLAPRRIFTLSHMETLAVHELNDKSEELKEPQPLDFGDVRQRFDCDYVVDVYPGYIAAGKSHDDERCQLKIIPFNNEIDDVSKAVVIENPHASDVVRDVFIPSSDTTLLYSCGEDGSLKIWKYNNNGNGTGSLTIPETFWDYSKKLNVLDETNVEVNMIEEDEEDLTLKQDKAENTDLLKREASEQNEIAKEKKKKYKKNHHKKYKHKTSKKSSKSLRYKPY